MRFAEPGGVFRLTAKRAGPLILVWLIAISSLLRGQNSGGSFGVVHTIDPNSAPWWELMVLPEIGESGAKDIVAFREASCGKGAVQAFRHAGDLDLVRGIGPKTLVRISPYLRFHDRCP